MTHSKDKNALMIVKDWSSKPAYFDLEEPSFREFTKFVGKNQYMALRPLTQKYVLKSRKLNRPMFLVFFKEKSPLKLRKLKIVNYWLKV